MMDNVLCAFFRLCRDRPYAVINTTFPSQYWLVSLLSPCGTEMLSVEVRGKDRMTKCKNFG